MNELLALFSLISMAACVGLSGLVVAELRQRRSIIVECKEIRAEIFDVAAKLRGIQNENVTKMVEIMDKLNVLEFKVKGK